MSVEGVDWDEIDDEHDSMPYVNRDADDIDRHEARFRLGMEPFEQREKPRFPWELVLLLAGLAAVFAGLLAFGVVHTMGEINRG